MTMCVLVSTSCHKKAEENNSNQAVEEISEGKEIKSTPVLLHSIEATSFYGPDFAWIVTGTGNMLRSSNGGATWEKVNIKTILGNNPVGVQVSFLDDQRGWAVNGQGQIWHSRNGGNTWTRIFKHIKGNGIKFIDDDHSWVSELFSLWRTEDGGKTWSSQDFPLPISLIDFQNYNEGWVCTQSLSDRNNIIYRTKDGGKTWEGIEIENTKGTRIGDSVDIRDLFFIDEQRGWLADRHSLRRTDDGGTTWQVQTIPGKGITINSICFLSGNEGWAAGNEDKPSVTKKEFSAILLHSSDSGNTWQSVPVEGNDLGYDKVYFADPQNGWLVGGDKIYRTANGGQDWKIVLRVDGK